MTGTKLLNDRIATLLAADTTTLAQVGLVNLHLAKEPFTEGPDLLLGDLTEADFDGYAPLAVDSATAQVFTDPTSGDTVIQLDEPAGGWSWETTGTTDLPQTIYGFALTDTAGAVVHGSQLLDTPVVLDGTGQGFNIPNINFRLNAGAMS